MELAEVRTASSDCLLIVLIWDCAPVQINSFSPRFCSSGSYAHYPELSVCLLIVPVELHVYIHLLLNCLLMYRALTYGDGCVRAGAAGAAGGQVGCGGAHGTGAGGGAPRRRGWGRRGGGRGLHSSTFRL
jgi:hypothetical protein